MRHGDQDSIMEGGLTRVRRARNGPLAMIGGRLESDNAALFESLRTLSSGRIVVLAMASQVPEEVGSELVDDFRAYGCDTELLPLYWDNRERAAYDEALVARVAAAGSVFFSGGDQSRIVGSLIQHGEETPVLQQIRRSHAAGGLVAGTSAGAAIMSGPMILSGTSLEAVARGFAADDDDEGFRLGNGLGFFPWGLVDQHFLHRGRIGRLLMAARSVGSGFAFGIDENSAMLVDGSHARVCGETGVLVLDLRKARENVDGYDLRDVRISYLDDGDGFDLRAGKARPAPDKHRVRVSRASYRRPAPVRRNAFASYALHDLVLRLVEADPSHYRHDSALAFDAESRRQVCVEIERRPRRSRALKAVRDGEIRYSALNFELRVRSTTLPEGAEPPSTAIVLPPDPVPGARLVLLGNSPLDWDPASLDGLLAELVEPVGVLTVASAEPRRKSDEYLEWLRGRGLQAEALPVGLHNIERASRDRDLLKRIGGMGSLLFTGGDQRRITETLLHCAEATPVLHAIVSAYERGVPLVMVAAAAAASGHRMIVEGDSAAALRFGASEDAGFPGIVVEAGLGLSAFGLIDQNFLNRRRLGRLLVACVAENARFGFGLCEESGMVIAGGERRLMAIGRTGVIVASVDPHRASLRAPDFRPDGIRLNFVEPGTGFHLDTVAADAVDRTGTGLALLERAIADLVREYRAGTGSGHADVDPGLLRHSWVDDTDPRGPLLERQ
jgi:cyanophycinase